MDRRAAANGGLDVPQTPVILTAAQNGSMKCRNTTILRTDPFTIFAVSFRHLFLVAGLVELAVAIICFAPKKRNLAFILVSWMTANLIAYRAGLFCLGWHHPCRCLGTLTDALNIQPEFADLMLKLILFYLALGACSIWWFSYRAIMRPNRITHEQTL